MLTLKRANTLLIYSATTGEFFWRNNRGPVKAGQLAGWSRANGYKDIRIDGEPYLLHRLVWFFETGAFPPKGMQIDHRNRNKADSRAINLRLATASQNLANSHRPITNTSGIKGVSWNKMLGKWTAYIMVMKRKIHLGCFVSRDDAAASYASAAKEHFGEFALFD